MTTFDEREQGFERKFAHDQELEFKATARRNRLLGEWAAGLMGLATAEEYARAVVKSDFEQPGDEDVLRKVFEDLKGAGVATTEGEVRMKMAELLAQAAAQVKGERSPWAPPPHPGSKGPRKDGPFPPPDDPPATP